MKNVVLPVVLLLALSGVPALAQQSNNGNNNMATDYHYCGIDEATVKTLLATESKARDYNASIKGRLDCRVNPAPSYR